MNIRISYYGQSRQITGTKHEQLEVTGNATAPAVIQTLAKKYGANFANLLLLDGGALRKSVLLPINDEVTDSESILNENDEISIYPAISGG